LTVLSVRPAWTDPDAGTTVGVRLAVTPAGIPLKLTFAIPEVAGPVLIVKLVPPAVHVLPAVIVGTVCGVTDNMGTGGTTLTTNDAACEIPLIVTVAVPA
jgi:hypothetical protein